MIFKFPEHIKNENKRYFKRQCFVYWKLPLQGMLYFPAMWLSSHCVRQTFVKVLIQRGKSRKSAKSKFSVTVLKEKNRIIQFGYHLFVIKCYGICKASWLFATIMNLTVTKGCIYNMVWWIMHGEWSQTLIEREGRWLLSTVWHFLPAMVIHDTVLRGVQNVTGCHSNGTPSPRKEERLADTLRFARMEPQLQQSDHR